MSESFRNSESRRTVTFPQNLRTTTKLATKMLYFISISPPSPSISSSSLSSSSFSLSSSSPPSFSPFFVFFYFFLLLHVLLLLLFLLLVLPFLLLLLLLLILEYVVISWFISLDSQSNSWGFESKPCTNIPWQDINPHLPLSTQM